MRKFKDGDKVVFIEEHHSKDYVRNYKPSGGDTGVILSFSELYNEYIVSFENTSDTTFCYEGELELVKPKEYIDYCNNDVSVLKTTNIIVDDVTKGEWKNMKNEVLELWYARKHNKIMKEYEEKEREFHNSKELVIKYKEILDRFENELEELYESEENQEQNYIVNTMTYNLYEYSIDYKKLNDEFIEEYVIERNNKLRELDELRKEINAQLSLSNDLEYQLDVLTRYGVLNKKTKKMVD